MRFAVFDAAKFIGAILVIYGHTEPLRLLSPRLHAAVMAFAHLGVALFFGMAGFLFAREGDSMFPRERLGRFLRRVLRLYGVWCLLGLPVCALYFELPAALGEYVFDLVSGLWHLWFLTALLQAALLGGLLSRLFSWRAALAAAIGLYAAGTLLSTYLGVVPFTSRWYFPFVRNGVFYGLVFFLLGIAVRQLSGRLSAGRCAAGAALSALGLVAESQYLFGIYGGQSLDFYWCFLPGVGFGLLLMQETRLRLAEPAAEWLRRASTLIYCVHGFAIIVLLRAGLTIRPELAGILMFALTSGLSLLFAAVVIRLQRRFSWLRVLY